MNQPAVSVLIATRDRVALLQSALDAIHAQDYAGDIVVWCTFDADLPADLDLHFPEADDGQPRRQLHVQRNTGTPGLAGARNFGLACVETEFVALCDDDDTWHPHKLTEQVALAMATPDAACIGGGLRVLSGDDIHVRPAPASEIRFGDLLESRVMELHPSTLLLRTDVVRRIGGWDESLPGGYAEDYDLLLRLARTAPIAMADTVVADILWAGQSYYFSKWHMIAQSLTRMLDKFPEFASRPRGRARVRGQVAFALAASGERRQASRWIRKTLADNPREPRAALAALVALRMASPDFIQNGLHARGRGI